MFISLPSANAVCQMHSLSMLTESRKRRHTCEAEEAQAKRLPGHPCSSELGYEVWDSESSSSDCSGISSPERLAAAGSLNRSGEQARLCIVQNSSSPSSSHVAEELPSSTHKCDESYHLINRILKEAHFSSLKSHSQPGPT